MAGHVQRRKTLARLKRQNEKARETDRDELRRAKGYGGATNSILQRHGKAPRSRKELQSPF